MATRFYMDDAVAAPITPAFDAAWEQTGAADRFYSQRKGQVTAIGTLANQAAKTVPITTTQQILARQYITEGMPRRTRVLARISMVIRTVESASTANVFLAWVLRAVSNDGSTVRGTLGSSMTNTGTEFPTTAATRIFTLAGLSGTPLTLEEGDRLVFEIGGHAQAPTAAGTYTLRFGNSAATDFALTSALTTNLNPWWELDQDLWPAVPNNQLVVSSKSAGVISVAEGWR